MGLLSKIANHQFNQLITEKISNLEGQKLCSNDYSDLLVDYVEMGDYAFFEFHLISTFKIKTFKGCQLTFASNQETLTIESDTTEIDTDFSDTLQKGLTEFDIEDSVALQTFLENNSTGELKIEFEKSSVIFKNANFTPLIIAHLPE